MKVVGNTVGTPLNPKKLGGNGNIEWDYVITSADLTSIDPTTNEKVFDITKLATMLATMRGRVLVKGINYQPEFEYGDALDITIPNSISLIEFIDSTIFANITAKGSCKIIGFVGHNQYYFQFSSLTGFSWVEKCRGQLELYNCQNVIHSEIRSASLCNNLQDINASTDESDMFTITFNGCNLIDGVQVSTIGHDSDVEFQSCKNISNVRNLTPTFASIKYNGCTFVDGDTCDGYYTSADVGKVKTITNDGTTQLISPEEMGGGGTSAYDFVLEDEELWSDSLNGMSGDILVKGGIVMYSLSVPKEVKSIRFIATECLYEMIAGEIATPCTIDGHSSTKISGVEGDYVNLYSFGTVEDCHGIITLSNCSNISRCSLASLNTCSYVSKIRRGNDPEKVTYSNCKYVDGDTCQDFYSDEDVGKVKTVGPDGSASLANCGKVYMHTIDLSIYGPEEGDFIVDTECILYFVVYSSKSEPFKSLDEIPNWESVLPFALVQSESYFDITSYQGNMYTPFVHNVALEYLMSDDGPIGYYATITYLDTFYREDLCYAYYKLTEGGDTWYEFSDRVTEI